MQSLQTDCIRVSLLGGTCVHIVHCASLMQHVCTSDSERVSGHVFAAPAAVLGKITFTFYEYSKVRRESFTTHVYNTHTVD